LGRAGLTALSRKTPQLWELPSPHAGTLLTKALPLGSGIRVLGTPWEGWYLSLLAHSFCHSLLSLPLEAKLILATIFPTIATKKIYGLRLRLGMGLLTWFLSTRLLNRVLLTMLLTLFPKEHFSRSSYEFYGILEIICGVREYGWIWICVEFV
jgi:hypothetical protein